MDRLLTPLLDSWTRQSHIVTSVAKAMDGPRLAAKVADDEMDVAGHLCHIHSVRRFWWSQINQSEEYPGERLQDGDDQPCRDIARIISQLEISSNAVAETARRTLTEGQSAESPYDHPVLFPNTWSGTRAGISAQSCSPFA